MDWHLNLYNCALYFSFFLEFHQCMVQWLQSLKVEGLVCVIKKTASFKQSDLTFCVFENLDGLIQSGEFQDYHQFQEFKLHTIYFGTLEQIKPLQPVGCTVCVDSTGEIKHKVFPSRLQSLWDATGLLEENMLPLLLYWLSSRAKKILMLVDIGQRRVTFFFHVKWNFLWNWEEVVADQSSNHCFAPSYNHSLVSE